MTSRLSFFLLLGLSLSPVCAVAAEPRPRTNEIIVSAANYAEAPPAVLRKLFHDPADLADQPAPAAAERPVRYYQFLPGEKLPADLAYTDVCQLLVPALAQRNFVNTHDQAKVEFILRITYGERPWRDPFVRATDLEWKHGLVPRKRHTALGANAVWDDRAGGDEEALRQAELALSELMPQGGAEGMADSLIGGVHTEDYFLVVVDAFKVADLRAQGNAAQRAWSTFIAVPRQGKTTFSAVAAAMIAKAAPYFGETLPGKVRFTDREGKVTPGELKVIESDVATPKK